MAFELSGLTAYTEQNEQDLVVKSLFDATTQRAIQTLGNVMLGVKSSKTVNRMDTDAFFQSDSNCGFTASGTTEFTQRSLTVGKVKVQEALCPKDMEEKYLQKALPGGSTYDSIAFANDYTTLKTGKIAEALEEAIWKATGSGYGGTNGLLNKFKGIRQHISEAGGDVVDANTTGYYGTPATAINSSTIAKNAVKAVIKALPAKIQGKSDVRIFCGYDTYNLLVDAYVDANLFHFAPGVNSDDQNLPEFTVPGTSYKVIPVHGLDGTDAIYAFRMANIFLGTDLQNEEEAFQMWYSNDDMNVKFHTAFKIGVQFAFMDEVVKFEA